MEENLRNRAKTEIIGKQGDIKNCNSCNKPLPMSQAHVPPKGCIEEDFRDRIAFGYFDSNVHIFQNGTHYYTLCEPCNKSLGIADSQLISLSKNIRAHSSQIKSFRCMPNQIARSLVGGFLAASNKSLDDSYEGLRNYVRSDMALFPDYLKIGFWFHEYNSVFVETDFILVNQPQIRILFMTKYYPLAWIIYDPLQTENDFAKKYNLYDFSAHLSSDFNKTCKIRISHKLTGKSETWPSEHDGFAKLGGQSLLDNSLQAHVRTKP